MKTAEKILKASKTRNLTGEEMGRLILLDAIDSIVYEDSGKYKPLFSSDFLEREKAGFCDDLRQADAHDAYVRLKEALTLMHERALRHYERFQNGYYHLVGQLTVISSQLDLANQASYETPLILSEQEFKQTKKTLTDKLRAKEFTAAEIVFLLLDTFIENYTTGKGPVPDNVRAALDAAQKCKAKSRKVLANPYNRIYTTSDGVQITAGTSAEKISAETLDASLAALMARYKAAGITTAVDIMKTLEETAHLLLQEIAKGKGKLLDSISDNPADALDSAMYCVTSFNSAAYEARVEHWEFSEKTALNAIRQLLSEVLFFLRLSTDANDPDVTLSKAFAVLFNGMAPSIRESRPDEWMTNKEVFQFKNLLYPNDAEGLKDFSEDFPELFAACKEEAIALVPAVSHTDPQEVICTLGELADTCMVFFPDYLKARAEGIAEIRRTFKETHKDDIRARNTSGMYAVSPSGYTPTHSERFINPELVDSMVEFRGAIANEMQNLYENYVNPSGRYIAAYSRILADLAKFYKVPEIVDLDMDMDYIRELSDKFNNTLLGVLVSTPGEGELQYKRRKAILDSFKPIIPETLEPPEKDYKRLKAAIKPDPYGPAAQLQLADLFVFSRAIAANEKARRGYFDNLMEFSLNG